MKNIFSIVACAGLLAASALAEETVSNPVSVTPQGAAISTNNQEMANTVTQLDLLRPIYKKTTNYGHFTKSDLPWEQTDKVDALKKAIAKK